MLKQYNPKLTKEEKAAGKVTRGKSTYAAAAKKGRTWKVLKKGSKDEMKTWKDMKKGDEWKKNKAFQDKDGKVLTGNALKDAKKKYKKDYRDAYKTAKKADFKKNLKTYKGKVTEQKGNLIKAQRQCFKQIMRMTAGSLCLACDAGYKKYLKLADKAKNTWTMNIAQGSCDNLKEVCFDYLQERANAGQYLREAQAQTKKRAEWKKMKATVEKMEKCNDDNEFGCSTKQKDVFIAEASKVQEDEDKADTEDKQRENMNAKFEGGKGKAPMSVKLPDGCTSKDDCKWICTHMAKMNGGADMDAVDMKDQVSSDGETKFTAKDAKKKGRVLSTPKASISNSVVSSGGYEADSDANQSSGLDSDFAETVDDKITSGSGTTSKKTTTTKKSAGTGFSFQMTIGFSLLAILATLKQ